MKGDVANRASRAPVRVLIVDDHPMVREGLRELIERAGDMTVCGVAASGSAALEVFGRLHPDLVVLDLSLGDMDGTRMVREIVARSPQVGVLILSIYDESVYAERCLRAGARGYLNKRAAADEVLRAVRVVAEGGLYLSEATQQRRAASDIAGRGATDARTCPEILSDRELEVFQLLGHGYGPSQIADSLGLSVRTVEGYEARIKVKLDLETADALSRFAVEWYRGTDGDHAPVASKKHKHPPA